jgi:hypothetical protein
MTLLLTSSLAALFSPILRLHHTRGNERQQFKWFLFAAVPLTVILGLIELNVLIANLTSDFMFPTVVILSSSQVFTPVLFVAGSLCCSFQCPLASQSSGIASST